MAARIGLTGSIGCGKSTVGTMLQRLGAEYVDADQLVHALLAAGRPEVEAVVARFGEQVRASDGGIDRPRLGEIVFNDAPALRDLEAIVVPGVRTEIRRRLAATTAPAIVVDAIKLIESGLYRELDSVWVVICDPAQQRGRLTQGRGMSAEAAEARIAAQPPQQQRLHYADVVIDNSGTLAETQRQVNSAWERTMGATIAP